MSASTLDRSRPPRPAALRPFEFPHFERHQLDNGLLVVAARHARVPLVAMEVLGPGGGQLDSPERPGLASLYAALLDEGTERRSALEIAEAAERLGGALGSGADWDVSFVSIELLSSHLTEGLDLLAEVIRQPSFPAAEVERQRQRRLTEIQRRRVQPRPVAERTFAQAIYSGTVYGNPLIGTAECLEDLRRDDVLDFHRRHAGPLGSALIVIGDIDPQDVLRRAEAAFGDWPSNPPHQPMTIEPAPATGRKVHIVDMPQAAQTQLQLGHVGVARQRPGFVARRVMNCVLGGKFTSRINLNLREKHGFTYGAQSGFVMRRGPGPFLIRAAVATESTGAAVRELLHEMQRIRDEPVPPAELAETRDYLAGVLPYTLQTIGDLAKRLEDLVVFELADDYYERYPDALRSVTAEEVQAAARRYIRPDQAVIVAVGPATELAEQLEPFGPVEISEP